MVGALGLRVMVDRLKLVALGITQECGVILRMIIAQSRRTIIASSGREPGGMERTDLLDGRSPKAPVAARISRCAHGLIDAEVSMAIVIRPVPFPKTDGVVSLVGDDRSKSGHDAQVKRFDALQASNRD